MLNVYDVRHGVIVNKVQETFSCEQSKRLEKYITFITQKGNQAKINFEKDFQKLLNRAFYGKTLENVRTG